MRDGTAACLMVGAAEMLRRDAIVRLRRLVGRPGPWPHESQRCVGSSLFSSYCRRHILTLLTANRSLLTYFLALLTANCLLITPLHAGCGLTWSMPTNHFDGVDRLGYVSLWYKIGEVKLDEKLSLPLHMNFNSSRQTSSPYLGAGWSLALLESQIVQQEENRFRLVEPSGWGRFFWRKNASETVLDGQGGWKAEIRGDRISAWATCGTRLDYYRGRIVAMKTGGHDIQFIQHAGALAEIRSGTRTLVRVERDAKGEVTGLVLHGDERITLESGEKPRVESVAKNNLLAGVEQALTRVEYNAGAEIGFDYKVDDKVRPMLVVNRTRELVWNPEDGRMIRDEDWIYNTIHSGEYFDNAAIERSNSSNQIEFWHYNGVEGQETRLFGNGVRTTRRWFTAGVLMGKDREVYTKSAEGTLLQSRRYLYDENGRKLRMDGSATSVAYLDSESSTVEEDIRELLEQGDIHEIHLLDPAGRISEAHKSDGTSVKYTRMPDSTLIVTFLNDSHVTRHRYNSNAELLEREILSVATDNPESRNPRVESPNDPK